MLAVDMSVREERRVSPRGARASGSSSALICGGLQGRTRHTKPCYELPNSVTKLRSIVNFLGAYCKLGRKYKNLLQIA